MDDKKIRNLITKRDLFKGNDETDMGILLGKSIVKDKCEMTICDDNTTKLLEQEYLNDSLNQTGMIDVQNFPQDIPDRATCEILDGLYSKNQLPFRQVKYCIGELTNPIHVTNYFKEYNYNDRKFIRYQAMSDSSNGIMLSNGDTISNGKFYWIEVKPIDLTKTLYWDQSDTTENAKRM